MIAHSFKLLVICLVLASGLGATLLSPLRPHAQDAGALFETGQRQQQDGNFKLAADAYRQVVADANAAGTLVARSLQGLQECLQALRLAEIDEDLATAVRVHSTKVPVLASAARILATQEQHYGTLADQRFHRAGGVNRVRGTFVNVFEQDRLQVLKWIGRARELAEEQEVEPGVLAELQLAAAEYLLMGREGRSAWRLQALTDLSAEPDYTAFPAQSPSWAGTAAPVDDDGQPLLYTLPQSYAKASSDGERVHWLLMQVERDPNLQGQGKLKWAQFLESQFSVMTLGGLRIYRDDQPPSEDGVYALHLLKDTETIARLANGVQRFALPEEFNHVLIYRSLQTQAGSVGETARRHLYHIYLNRRQYTQAAEIARQNPAEFSDEELQHIVGPRLLFTDTGSFQAGRELRLPVVFRNAQQVEMSARLVDQERLIADVKQYYRNYRPGQRNTFDGDGEKHPPNLQIPQPLFDQQKIGKYLNPPTTWTVTLNPRPNHWDRRSELETPLKERGMYLVEARASLVDGDGRQQTHLARRLVSLQDSVLMQRPLKSGATLYQFLDSGTGEPLAGANLEFFGWDNSNNRVQQTRVANYSRLTDELGQTVHDSSDRGYQWLVIARGKDGQLSIQNFDYLYTPAQAPDEPPTHVRAYGVSDRPVYRPGETVHTKFWLARPNYARENSAIAEGTFNVTVLDPQNQQVHRSQVTTDSFGGFELNFDLPAQTPLGLYRFTIESERSPAVPSNPPGVPEPRKRGGVLPPHALGSIYSSLMVRVEEYRKPEFEVDILAPKEPVALGETIAARIQAKYYFGAPVTDAQAVVKVERVKHAEQYFPVMPYDWCYGPGYWWFAGDYDWYPGYRDWCGCVAGPSIRPRFGREPPELVLEQQLELDATGEAEISIDSALAKAVFGDTADHEYRISVEVRDASRRTITASGSVIAARQPFKIYTWLHHGYYRTGQPMEVQFESRRMDGEGVASQGALDLLRIRYDAEGQPREELVQSFDVHTEKDGRGAMTLTAAQAGQYRLRLRLEDAAQHRVEGGYIVTVRGRDMQGTDFRYSGLEIVPDKMHYQPGEKVQLQLSANRDDALVMLFVRPVQGAYEQPRVVRLQNKSAIVELAVAAGDQPNFFVEATTVYDGQLHREIREIHVPPADKVLEVELQANRQEYLPGQEAEVQLEVQADGQPQQAACVIAVYDRALEQLAPEALPSDIREFFWKWQRHHYPRGRDTLQTRFASIGIHDLPNFRFLGAFGQSLADDLDAFEGLFDGLRAHVEGQDQLPFAEAISLSVPFGTAARRGAVVGDGVGGAAANGEAFLSAPGSTRLSKAGRSFATSAEAGVANVDTPPAIRQDFADQALWIGRLETDEQGRATAKFQMPENLTGWSIASWALGAGTRVGSAKIQAVTRKPLLVRLQLPRFLVERDEAVLSSIVHNDLATPQSVRVRLEIDGETQLALLPNQAAEQVVDIDAHQQVRVDWRCRAFAAGTVTVRTLAISDAASDAMQLELPIAVHGTLQTEAWAGTISDERTSAEIALRIPERRHVEQSKLTVRVSPSLAASMLDALPYLVDYPYGCTEQTLNRFLPTVLTSKTLRQLGVDLETLHQHANNLNSQELGPAAERRQRWGGNPALNPNEVQRMAQAGVDRLASMQNQDGGWGWFPGSNSRSSAHLTALVLRGLLVARDNQVAILPDTLTNAQRWLADYQDGQLQELKQWEETQKQGKAHPDNTDAFVFHVLTLADQPHADMQARLYASRNELGVYGKSLLALATHALGNVEQTRMLRTNIEQFLHQDAENETAFLADQTSPWWLWYGSPIESNAMYLKLLCQVDPQSDVAPRLVKYLLNNRRHATYWGSTRDTAFVVEAFADYLKVSGELQADMTVEAYLDDSRIGTIVFTPEKLLEVDNTIELVGPAIPAGAHRLSLKRQGEGNLYWNVYSTNFTYEDDVQPAGLEVKIERRYTLLTPDRADLQISDADAQLVDTERSAYRRSPLEEGMAIASGSLIEVELLIESKNDYEYLLVEDRKPAGLESVENQSGYFYSGGLQVYRELRDRHIGLCFEKLPRGKVSVRYRLRSETPGRFTALPGTITGMYAPELTGNSSDFDINITE